MSKRLRRSRLGIQNKTTAATTGSALGVLGPITVGPETALAVDPNV